MTPTSPVPGSGDVAPSHLLDGSLTPGRYRLSTPDSLGDEVMARSVADKGWQVARMTGTTNKAEFLAEVGRALDFPGYYGANFDAFADCLSDLVAPTALFWRGWEELAFTDPDTWWVLGEIFGQRYEAIPPFALVLLG